MSSEVETMAQYLWWAPYALSLLTAYAVLRLGVNGYRAVWMARYGNRPFNNPKLERMRKSMPSPRYGLYACCWASLAALTAWIAWGVL